MESRSQTNLNEANEKAKNNQGEANKVGQRHSSARDASPIPSVAPIWPKSKDPIPPELGKRMVARQEIIKIVEQVRREVWGTTPKAGSQIYTELGHDLRAYVERHFIENNDKVVWKYHPIQVYCANCEEPVITVVNYKWGCLTTFSFIISLFSFLFCCCFVAMKLNTLKDVEHFCPHKKDGCGLLLGTYKRTFIGQ
uniref:LITAF domain-containing protein n=1 Tax=Ditylenchus dipsaci TaxID=166011 RepID=A0A915DRS3_9BILA